jgi:hypothetical protein
VVRCLSKEVIAGYSKGNVDKHPNSKWEEMIKRQQAWIMMNVLLMVFCASFVCRAANDNDEQRQWTEVKRWSGTGIKTTEKFTVGKEWRIRWTNRGSFFTMTVYRLGDKEPAAICIPVTTTAQESNVSYVYQGGELYLLINGMGGWEVIVEQPVSDEKTKPEQPVEKPSANADTPTRSNTNEAQSSLPPAEKLKERIPNLKAFFKDFIEKKTPPAKSAFETEEEYQQRIPQPFDDTELISFAFDSAKYAYDMNTEKLTLFAGAHFKKKWGLLNKPRRYSGADKGTPIVMLSEEEQSSYDTTNGFGAPVTIVETLTTEYILNFSNLNLCPPEIFNSKKSEFKISFSIPPKEGEQLINHFGYMLVVRLPGYSHSGSFYWEGEPPAFSHPYQQKFLVYQIDAELVKVVVRDNSSNRILAEYEIKPKEAK